MINGINNSNLNISSTNITQSTQSTQYKGNTTATQTETQTSQLQVDSFQSNASSKAESLSYDPAAVAKQMKADLESHQLSLLKTVKNMLAQQGIAVSEGNGVWKQLASGNFQVDKETSDAAKEAISDGGYWSAEKTSERLLKYAKALVGGDPSKMEAMREAVEKGFKAATKSWGGKLPDITQQTYDATMKLFDDWGKENENNIAAAV